MFAHFLAKTMIFFLVLKLDPREVNTELRGIWQLPRQNQRNMIVLIWNRPRWSEQIPSIFEGIEWVFTSPGLSFSTVESSVELTFVRQEGQFSCRKPQKCHVCVFFWAIAQISSQNFLQTTGLPKIVGTKNVNDHHWKRLSRGPKHISEDQHSTTA